jgi:hypothetical protein
MNEAGSKPAIKRKRGAIGLRAPKLGADYTAIPIRIPIPPASAMNRDRPISSLIKAQLLHIQHAESARLPKDKRVGVKLEDIHTEAEAAAYIASVTRVLHPQGRKRSRRKPRS